MSYAYDALRIELAKVEAELAAVPDLEQYRDQLRKALEVFKPDDERDPLEDPGLPEQPDAAPDEREDGPELDDPVEPAPEAPPIDRPGPDPPARRPWAPAIGPSRVR